MFVLEVITLHVLPNRFSALGRAYLCYLTALLNKQNDTRVVTIGFPNDTEYNLKQRICSRGNYY